MFHLAPYRPYRCIHRSGCSAHFADSSSPECWKLLSPGYRCDFAGLSSRILRWSSGLPWPETVGLYDLVSGILKFAHPVYASRADSLAAKRKEGVGRGENKYLGFACQNYLSEFLGDETAARNWSFDKFAVLSIKRTILCPPSGK